MAEATAAATEAVDIPAEETEKTQDSSTLDMKVEAPSSAANPKRGKEEVEDELEKENGGGGDAKKQKVGEKSVEEERLEKEKPVEVTVVGSKSFGSSVEIYDYFFKLLHFWPPNLNINQYEHIMLLDLLKKGHLDPDKKIGKGVSAFQVRYHPQFKSRCFYVIREDKSVDDFSFRKCVDHILPLPENMQVKPDVNKALGGCSGRGSGGRGGGHCRGRGRGHRSRH